MQATTHFTVLGITPQIDETSTLTIAHYGDKNENDQEFVVQSLRIEKFKRNEFLDLTNKIEQIENVNYPKS